MNTILDVSVGQVIRDDKTFHRLLSSVEQNSPEMSYVDAMHLALNADPSAQVRDVLKSRQVNLDAVATDVQTREQRDDAVARIELQAAELRTLDGDPSSGLPKIDGATYGEVMRAQPVSWDRLFEARQLTGSYEGSVGEGRFADEDRQLAAAGYDFVGGLRHGVANAGVQRTLTAAVQKMDQAIEKGSGPSERRRLLQAAVSEGVKRLDEAVSSARRSLDLEPSAPTPQSLDPSFAVAVRQLEQHYGNDRAGFAGAYGRLLDSQ